MNFFLVSKKIALECQPLDFLQFETKFETTKRIIAALQQGFEKWGLDSRKPCMYVALNEVL